MHSEDGMGEEKIFYSDNPPKQLMPVRRYTVKAVRELELDHRGWGSLTETVCCHLVAGYFFSI